MCLLASHDVVVVVGGGGGGVCGGGGGIVVVVVVVGSKIDRAREGNHFVPTYGMEGMHRLTSESKSCSGRSSRVL